LPAAFAMVSLFLFENLKVSLQNDLLDTKKVPLDVSFYPKTLYNSTNPFFVFLRHCVEVFLSALVQQKFDR